MHTMQRHGMPHARVRGARSGNGFTIIELMLTLAVAAVILAVAIPSFREIVLNSRRTTAANDLIAAFNLARSESQKRGRSITVCASTSGSACASSPVTAWSSGWLVFVDLDEDRTVDSGETLLQYFQQVATITIQPNGASTRTAFRFQPFNKPVDNDTLKICDSRGSSAARSVTVNQTGRSRVSSDATDATGTALTC